MSREIFNGLESEDPRSLAALTVLSETDSQALEMVYPRVNACVNPDSFSGGVCTTTGATLVENDHHLVQKMGHR